MKSQKTKVALTSISPVHHHAGIQKHCTDTWLEHGLKIVSFNTPDEVAALSPEYPDVEFVPTFRTMQHKFGKPYVQVNALLDWAKESGHEEILIINSDIFLRDAGEVLLQGFELAKEGCVYAHRVDVNELTDSQGEPYIWGMDVFFLHPDHLHVFPQTLYCLGQTFWDYWVPYTVKKAGLKIHEIKTPFAYHLLHPQRWSELSWHKMAEYVSWDTNQQGAMRMTPMQQKRNTNTVSSKIYREIKATK